MSSRLAASGNLPRPVNFFEAGQLGFEIGYQVSPARVVGSWTRTFCLSIALIMQFRNAPRREPQAESTPAQADNARILPRDRDEIQLLINYRNKELKHLDTE
jgi:hypothetical protein